ncbi:STAS/SEC14 domain-containing protein [Hymenobacter aerophilus]|uniref:STAS/SEC14 domain-containing protein n=1 Tax=Hymenobacter aerophilus TaxID=119644 RepID=UPI0012FAC99D|nr:STAS/SEC14 domain-containing protein [Hymenobacter aerophilus]
MIERLLTTPESPHYCRLRYLIKPRQLTVTWQGHVTAPLAYEGAQAALDILRQHPCCCLLNDNTALEGPWFDSLLWLAQRWAPAAAQAGVRFVAHVVRAGTLATTFVASPTHLLFTEFEIQIFDSLAEAEDWLASCRG